MYKKIIIISLFLNINSLFASEPTSQSLHKVSFFKNIENQASAVARLETEVARLNSENIELRNNINFLNNIVLSVMKAQSDLLTLVQNNFSQQLHQKATPITQDQPINTVMTHSSISSITTKKQPLIRRSSFTSTGTKPQ